MTAGSTPPARPKRLLLFGINYAPEETGIAPYTTEMAEHMAANGWDVTAIVGMPHYPQWRVEGVYRRHLRFRERRRAVEVRRVRQYTPSSQSAAGRVLYEATYLLQALVHDNISRPDCVIGVVPSLGGGVAAALMGARFGVPVGIILQDLVGQAAAQSGIPGGGLAARPAQAIEAWVARRASLVAVVAEAFRPYLAQAGVQSEKVVHLPNWAHVMVPSGGVDAVRRSLGWSADQFVVLHAGNMGYKQDLGNVIEAARLSQGVRSGAHFVLMGDGSDRRRLEVLASGLSNVEFLPPQPKRVFMDVLAAADVLLVNERASIADMSLPSKITSYFRAGKPVVAAVPAGGATAKELARSGGALLAPAADPAALVAAVQRVESDPNLGAQLVRCGSRYSATTLDRDALLRRTETFVTDLEGGGLSLAHP